MQLLIDRADIRQTRIAQQPERGLQQGEVRVALRRCALTANNVTYAAAGEMLKYWAFFPSGEDGQGLLPVWGTADVIESRSAVLARGARLYGFWPLAETCVLVPEEDASGMMVDRAPHRADLPAVYNRYAVVQPAPEREEDLRALLQPLLATSWLITDFLADNEFFGARQIVVGSASSKTGLGLCKFLSQLDGHPVNVIGLTGVSNREYVDKTGACDAVFTYDQIADVPRVASVFVDMAGNATVRQTIHSHLDDALKHSAAVGTSHWDKFRPDLKLDGPRPQFFFAPAQIAKRREDWPPGVVEKRIAQAWKGLAADSADWLDVNVHNGLQAALDVYELIATGQSDARQGHVIVFG